MTSATETTEVKSIVRPNLQEVDGLYFYEGKSFWKESLLSTMKMQLSAGDVVICTYPKCGTTWMQYIVWGIINDGPEECIPVHEMNYKIFPFMEMVGAKVMEGRPHPWYLKVHLPYKYTPYNPDAKYIYVARNPKDTCVSVYHFYKQMEGLFPDNMTFRDMVENFLEGYMPYGDFFDHVLTWYEHKDDPNVFFITYEEMKADPKKAILDVARFLGREHEEKLLKDEDMLNRIIKSTTFQNMKKLPYVFNTAGNTMPGENANEKTGEQRPSQITFQFFRKGKVGDYKNYFTEDLERRLDERMAERLASAPRLYDLWKSV